MAKITTWHNCYDSSLKGLVTKASFAHPAKMARGLTERILDHGEAMGYWKPGDIILDPFAGIFTTGVVGAYRGYRVIGVELEPKFYRMAVGHDCPGVSKAQWCRWQGRFGHIKDLCPACQSGKGETVRKDQGTLEYQGDGLIPFQPAHRYVGNIFLNARKWATMGLPVPMILQGDSRKLRQHVACALGIMPFTETVKGIITSPPFSLPETRDRSPLQPGNVTEVMQRSYTVDRQGTSEGNIAALPVGDISGALLSPPFAGNSGGTGEASSGPMNALNPGVFERHLGSMRNGAGYGASDGQINAMPEGDVEKVVGAVLSPPYADTDIASKTNGTTYGGDFARTGKSPRALAQMESEKYGATPGQLSAMPAGDVDKIAGILTSPPYADGSSHTGGNDPSPSYLKGGTIQAVGLNGATATARYGDADGQIGLTEGETYWTAVAKVYQELYQLLPSGGAAAVVVKNYVKNKKIAPLCDQTAQLLTAIGFEVRERCHAMLVKEKAATDMFGETHTKKTSRKSFFRRLAEKRGSPAIDHEEVIWAIKSSA